MKQLEKLKPSIKKILPFFLGVLVFSYLSIYILPINIHGDGFTHAYVAEEMANTKTWVDHIPHLLSSIENDGQRIYSPIHYPETSYVLMAIFYLIGGELGFKFYSIILGTIIAVLVFLLLKNINPYGAFLAGLGSVILNAKRFVMTPLIEPFLIVNFLLFLYFYFNYAKNRKKINLVLGGIFLGLFFASKHIAVYIYLLIILVLFIYYLYQFVKSKKVKHLYPFLILLSISLLISAMPIHNQLERVGTIGYGYGTTRVPKYIPFNDFIQKTFFESKIQPDPEVAEETDELLNYRVRELPLFEAYQRYILFPIFYENKTKDSFVFWLFCFSAIFIKGLSYTYKKNKYLTITLFAILFSEFIVTFFLKQRIFQYHVIGVVILVIFMAFGLIGLLKYFKSLPYYKITTTLFLVMFLSQLILGYYNYMHSTLWLREGRNTDEELSAYKKMGDFVKKNTSEEAIIISSGPMLGKYGDRDVIWHGAHAYQMFKSKDYNESLNYLIEFNINYIMVNNIQTTRSGVYDYLPPNGFLPALDILSCFEKKHRVDFITKDGYEANLSLYKFNSLVNCQDPNNL